MKSGGDFIFERKNVEDIEQSTTVLVIMNLSNLKTLLKNYKCLVIIPI